MERVEQEVEVAAPLTVVYNQWTQFEEFPEFMEGVTEVRQLDHRRLYWSAVIQGRELAWEAEIYEQTPETCIKWRGTAGPTTQGAVYFTEKGRKTVVRLVYEYEPDELMEKASEALAYMTAQLSKNLRQFREFIERRGRETGGWTGALPAKHSH